MSTPTATPATSATTSATKGESTASRAVTKSGSSELVNENGRTTIADAVVAKIAGIAAREIDGVYDLGGSAARVIGKVRDVIPGSNTNVTQGITVEVGERQAAVDVGVVVDYGVAIHELAGAIRRNIIDAIEQMTSLEVTEVNVAVHDIHLGDDDESDQPSRVQ